jgi:hypothetical protein
MMFTGTASAHRSVIWPVPKRNFGPDCWRFALLRYLRELTVIISIINIEPEGIEGRAGALVKDVEKELVEAALSDLWTPLGDVICWLIVLPTWSEKRNIELRLVDTTDEELPETKLKLSAALERGRVTKFTTVGVADEDLIDESEVIVASVREPRRKSALVVAAEIKLLDI